MIAAVVALAVAAVAPAPDAVRVRARPELPWVVAVVALDVDVTADQAAQAIDPKRPANRALADAGGRLEPGAVDQRFVFVARGPPEAHDQVVRAARAVRDVVPGGRATIFVDGRTTLTDAGDLPPRRDRTRTAAAGSPAGALSSPLVPDPGLLDVEGAMLEQLVEDALRPLGPAAVAVDAARDRAVLRIVTAAPKPAVKQALEAAVAQPLTPRALQQLRARALGRIAARRAPAGGWALDMARRYLGFGSLDVVEVPDLGPRLRARVFPDRLAR